MTHTTDPRASSADSGQIILHHYPDCSQSRAVLALLEENDITPEIIYYLDQSPTISQLQRPIVVKGNAAIVGRPPEKALQFLDL